MSAGDICTSAQFERVLAYIENTDGVTDEEAKAYFTGADRGAPNEECRDQLHSLLREKRPELAKELLKETEPEEG